MPVNVFRPRGATGGYDRRTEKAFQPGSTVGVIDPLAAHKVALAANMRVKVHAVADSPIVESHAAAVSTIVESHAMGINAVVK